MQLEGLVHHSVPLQDVSNLQTENVTPARHPKINQLKPATDVILNNQKLLQSTTKAGRLAVSWHVKAILGKKS
jgi:hypothetical protein